MNQYNSNATEAIAALLRGRNRQVWLAGVSALEAIKPGFSPIFPDVITDASPEECQEVRTIAADMGTSRICRIEALNERSLEDVLKARGITVDAIAVAENGDVIDPFGGCDHIAAKVVRTIDPLDRAFRETPILLARVARVIASTGFTTSSEMLRLASRDAGNILSVPDRNAQWGLELNALLLGIDVESGLQWLDDCRVLPYFMPEVAAMINFNKTCTSHHKDLWEHTKQVTQKAERDPVVRWAALCHDIGKVWTRSVSRNGKVHFFRHEEHGALLFESIGFRFNLEEELRTRVAYLIEHHSRVNLYESNWTDSAVRRLVRETEGHLHDLLTFSKADFTTKRTSRIREMQNQLRDLEERIQKLAEEDAKKPPLPTGLGASIMDRFQLKPSRLIGDLKKELEEAVSKGELPEQADDQTYVTWLVDNPNTKEKIIQAGGQV